MIQQTLRPPPPTLDELYARLDDWLAEFETYTRVRYPIYIPSRGRAESVLVARRFDEADLDYRVVIEPQDETAYLKQYHADRLLVLDRNDAGVAYVRNYIRDHAEELGYLYHWQFDDNIRAFRIRRDGRVTRASARNALAFVEAVVDNFTNIGGANLANAAHAFAYDNKPILRINNQVYCAMLLRTDVASRFRVGIHEDTDYSLQLLHEGWTTLVFKRVVMEKVQTGKMRGGNTDTEYAGDGRRLRFEALAEAWPEAKFRTKIKNGHWTVTTSRIWGRFSQVPELRVSAPILRADEQ